MPQMERNLDLENVDSDTLFGLEALKYQSIGQKILFYGCLIAGILANTVMPRFLHTPGIVNVLTFTVLLAIGIAGGCNYTQDMSYGKYVICILFEKKKTLVFHPTEDVDRPQKMDAKETETPEKADPKHQKKMVAKAVLLILALITMLIGIYLYQDRKEADSIHHETTQEGGTYE